MQIQRIQTLMLLVAAILTGLFCCMPFASREVGDAASQALYAKDAPVLLVLNIAITVLLLIVIFMYKNLRQQMRMTVLSIVLICGSIVTSGFIIYVGYADATPVLAGGVLLLVAALVFAIVAFRGMKHDHHLLRSMDRLR